MTAWPPLPLAGWRDTFVALHLRTQMVGKTMLALAPTQNHWWHTALHLTARGLTSGPLPAGPGRTLEVELDFLDHRLVARTGEGDVRLLPLQAEPVADFWAAYRRLLDDLGVPARIWPVPVEMSVTTPFADDRQHAAYDPEAVRRFFHALASAAGPLAAFRGRFLGKSSPVHFWWGACDLSCTRFSGQRAPRHPGGVPGLADRVTREAYSHACASAGWWPGTPGGLEEPAFYAYAYPEPPGYGEAAVRPAAARYDATLREWVLPYDAVRAAADPERELLAFLDDTYAAAADLAGWDRAALERGDGPVGSSPS